MVNEIHWGFSIFFLNNPLAILYHNKRGCLEKYGVMNESIREF